MNTWQIKKLGEIISLEYGKGLTERVRVSGSVPVYGSNGLVGSHNSKLVDGPGIIVGRKGSIGAIVWTDSDFWPIDTTYYVKLLQKNELKYIYFLLKTLKLNSLNKASGVPGLNRNDVYQINIKVPPLNIQQQIVEKLDAIRELQELNQKEMEKADELFNSFIVSEISINKDARVYRFDGIAEFQYGFTAEGKDKGDYRLIRITDIDESGRLRNFGKKFVLLKEKEAKPHLLRNGDLLVARTGATYGKFLLFNSREPSVYASYLIRVSFNPEVAFPRFIWLFTRTESYWIQARKLVTGSGQPQFNANRIKHIEIPLPPLSRQREIVDNAEHLLSYSLSLTREDVVLKELFESMLNKQMRPN